MHELEQEEKSLKMALIFARALTWRPVMFWRFDQFMCHQSVDTKSLSTLGLYKDQLRTQILKNKYQLGTKCDSKKEDQGPGLKVIF